MEKITLDKSTAILQEGNLLKLKATISPNNATDKTVKWSSSDQSVARVFNGEVYGMSEGTAIIFATSKGGLKTASCVVTVVKSNPFASLKTISKNERLNTFNSLIKQLKDYVPTFWGIRDHQYNISLGGGSYIYFKEEATGGLSLTDHVAGNGYIQTFLDKNFSAFDSFVFSNEISEIEVSSDGGKMKYSANSKSGNTTAKLSAIYDVSYNTFNMECSIGAGLDLGTNSGEFITTLGISTSNLMPPSSMVAEAFEQQRAEAFANNRQAFMDSILKGVEQALNSIDWKKAAQQAGLLFGTAVLLTMLGMLFVYV